MLTLLSTYSKEIVSILAPIVAWVLNGGLRRRAKLLWTEQHSASIITQQEAPTTGEAKTPASILVRTRSLYFRNVGNEPATKLEIVFNWRPQYFNVWPQRSYEERLNPEGRFILYIDNLSTKEFVTVDLLSLHELPNLITVRCEQGVGREITTSPQEVHPKWKLLIVVYLMALGLAATVYILISLLQVVVLRTPIWFQ